MGRMDSTMRAHLRRVHGLMGRALFFGVAAACALQAAAQVHCVPERGQLPVRGILPEQVSAQLGDSWLRLDAGGRRCEVRLDGRISAWAVSGPGQPTVIAVATRSPAVLSFLAADLQLMHRVPLRDRTGQPASSVCALLVSPQRQSFVAVFSATAELWELSYNPLAAEIGLGMVHDFQYREGHFVPGYLNPLRTALPWSVASAGLDVDGHLVQLDRRAPTPASESLVVHLDVRKPVPETARLATQPKACVELGLLQK